MKNLKNEYIKLANEYRGIRLVFSMYKKQKPLYIASDLTIYKIMRVSQDLIDNIHNLDGEAESLAQTAPTEESDFYDSVSWDCLSLSQKAEKLHEEIKSEWLLES